MLMVKFRKKSNAIQDAQAKLEEAKQNAELKARNAERKLMLIQTTRSKKHRCTEENTDSLWFSNYTKW